MRNIPHEDEVNIKALSGELVQLKKDLADPDVYAAVGEEQLLMWIEEVESIKKTINNILRSTRGN